MSYNTDLQSKNNRIQALIDKANTLPDANGAKLPELENPAEASEIFLNKEVIGANGTKMTGTFTLDSDLNEHGNIIAQIQNAVDSLPNVGDAQLPTLSNPATSNEILDGYEAIGSDGNIVIGTHICESGGGENVSYDTCTVKFKTESAGIGAFYSAFENGKIVSKHANYKNGSETICENVICDTNFYIVINSIVPGYGTFIGATLIAEYGGYSSTKYLQFHITASANTEAYIECYDDD